MVGPDGHGFAKILAGGEPGEILNIRVVAKVPRFGEEKSNLQERRSTITEDNGHHLT